MWTGIPQQLRPITADPGYTEYTHKDHTTTPGTTSPTLCEFFNVPQSYLQTRFVRRGLRFIVLIREDITQETPPTLHNHRLTAEHSSFDGKGDTTMFKSFNKWISAYVEICLHNFQTITLLWNLHEHKSCTITLKYFSPKGPTVWNKVECRHMKS